MYFLLVKHVCFDIKVSLVFDMGDRSSIATPNFGGQSKEECNSSSQLKEEDKVVACWSYLYVKMALHSGAAPKMKVKSKFLYIDMWIISWLITELTKRTCYRRSPPAKPARPHDAR